MHNVYVSRVDNPAANATHADARVTSEVTTLEQDPLTYSKNWNAKLESEPLQYIELAPRTPASATVIWLHGLGADGNDLKPIARQAAQLAAAPIRHILPHAPVRKVTINNCQNMRAWYDISGFGAQYPTDWRGIVDSVQRIGHLIERLQNNGARGRIIVSGFSQGGTIALCTALGSGAPLAAVAALSSYLPSDLDTTQLGREPECKLPVFMAHGDTDPVIPLPFGQAACDRLCALGCTVEWHVYPMAHAICPQEIMDMAQWLKQVLV